MTFASIFHFEFWFLWCVVLGAFLEAFAGPEGVPWTPLGVIWGSFGWLFGLFGGPFGCCGVPWGPFGGAWDVPGRLGGDFQVFPGNSWMSFGSILASLFVCSSLFSGFVF